MCYGPMEESGKNGGKSIKNPCRLYRQGSRAKMRTSLFHEYHLLHFHKIACCQAIEIHPG